MHFLSIEDVLMSLIKLILPLKVPADATFKCNSKTTLKTTEINYPQRKLHWTWLKATHAHHSGLCEDRLWASLITPNIDLTWKNLNLPCRNQEIDFSLKQKSALFFSQTHQQMHHRYFVPFLTDLRKGNRENNVQPDKTVITVTLSL